MKELPDKCPKCGLDNISVGTSDNEVVCICKCLHSWEAGVLSDYGLSLSSVIADADRREEIKKRKRESSVTRLNSVLGMVTLMSALPSVETPSRGRGGGYGGGGGKKTRKKERKNSKGRVSKKKPKKH